MKKTMVFLYLLGSLLSTTPALADGMFYWTESSPPTIPYQRAILWFDGSRETLLVQSKYQTTVQTGGRLGWVIPVPSVPELASMDVEVADAWFRSADRASTPTVTHISDRLGFWLTFGVWLSAMLTLGASAVSPLVRRMHYVRQHRLALMAGSVLVAFPAFTVMFTRPQFWRENGTWFCPLMALLLPGLYLILLYHHSQEHGRGNATILSMSALISMALIVVFFYPTVSYNSFAPPELVEIVQVERAGIYDVQVVTADRARDLVDWLNRNEFRFDEASEQVFAEYLQRGWSFVVAQVDLARRGEDGMIPDALVAPLIVRFEAAEPVYPLALTATVGHKTEILLYLFSEQKWTANGRLALHYAGGSDDLGRYMTWEFSDRQVEPEGFFTETESALSYLCKFKGTMSAADMEQDLVFVPAGDQEPYRKHLTVW